MTKKEHMISMLADYIKQIASDKISNVLIIYEYGDDLLGPEKDTLLGFGCQQGLTNIKITDMLNKAIDHHKQAIEMQNYANKKEKENMKMKICYEMDI